MAAVVHFKHGHAPESRHRGNVALPRRKLFWTGSMDSMDGLSVEQGSSGMQLSQHSAAASQQSSLASVTPKSPVLVAAKRLAFELDQLSEVRIALP
jgi:hypothetical protein